jgi:hypothetical protein
VPDYARKQKGNRGCVTSSIVLLLVLALGIGGYFLVRTFILKGSPQSNTGGYGTPGTGTGSTNSSTATTGSQGSTPTSGTSSSSTEHLNLQVTYMSVGITITSTQLARSFADDTSITAGSAGIVRVNIRENNTTTHNPDYLENEAMLLLFPDGTTTKASTAQDPISPDGGVNRTNWLDYPLDNSIALTKLALRMGTQSQSQFTIPLQPNADLSKYQDKTSNPGTQFKYGSLSMTLKSATLSYSYNSQQATTGNRYVIVTLAAVNNTSNSVDISPSSYVRIQAGGNTAEPDSTYTLPYTVAANTSASGVVAFLVPENTSTFTLIMLAQSSASPVIPQVTQSFQIP